MVTCIIFWSSIQSPYTSPQITSGITRLLEVYIRGIGSPCSLHSPNPLTKVGRSQVVTTVCMAFSSTSPALDCLIALVNESDMPKEDWPDDDLLYRSRFSHGAAISLCNRLFKTVRPFIRRRTECNPTRVHVHRRVPYLVSDTV